MNRTLRTALYALSIASSSLIACGDDEEHGHDGGHEGDHDEDDAGSKPELGFFVASDTSKTGDLGGLSGADARCNWLAMAAGVKSPKFAAYAVLSVRFMFV